MNFDIFIALAGLSILSVYCIYLVFASYVSNGALSFKFLSLAMFFVVHILSGFAHLLFTENFYRGFFDSVYFISINGGSWINAKTVFYIFLFLFSYHVCGRYFAFKSNASMNVFFGKAEVNNHANSNYFLLFLLATLLAFVALYARFVISGQIDITEVVRFRELPEGIAKYVFLNSWLSWSLLLYLYIIIKKLSLNDFYLSVIAAVFSVVIVYNISWTVGRIVAVIYTLPMLMLLMENIKSKKSKYIIIACGGLAIVLYSVAVTALRKEGYAVEETALSQVFDWELGRYSMISFGMDYVDRYGILYGSTVVDAVLRIMLAPIYFLGLGADFMASNEGAIIAYTAFDILGDSSKSYIVPGMLSEFYINFGMLGAPILAVIFTLFVNYFDNKIKVHGTSPASFIYQFIGALLVFNFFNATSLSFLSYIFYNGFPLILLHVFYLLKRQFFQVQKVSKAL